MFLNSLAIICRVFGFCMFHFSLLIKSSESQRRPIAIILRRSPCPPIKIQYWSNLVSIWSIYMRMKYELVIFKTSILQAIILQWKCINYSLKSIFLLFLLYLRDTKCMMMMKKYAQSNCIIKKIFLILNNAFLLSYIATSSCWEVIKSKMLKEVFFQSD